MSNPNMIQRPASASNDLLFIDKGDASSAKMRDGLQRKGFKVKNASNPEDAASIIGSLVRPIIIIDCGTRPGARDFVTPFCKAPILHLAPAIVLGKDVDGLADDLNQVFALASTLRTPCSQQDLLDTLNYISSNYPERSATRIAPPPSKEAAPPTQTPLPPPAPAATDDEAGGNHSLYKKYDSIPGLYFEQLRRFNILDRNLGGASFISMSQSNEETASSTLSSDPKRRAAVKEIQEAAGKWGRNHLQRVSYITEQILAPLEIELTLREASRSASSLYALSVSELNRSIFRKEFIGRGSLLLRKELCSRIKDSAYLLATTYQFSLEAEIVSVLAKLVGREEEVADTPVNLVASAIMAADLTDRLCYQSGHWNPRAAHSLLRRIGSGRLRDLHPAVTCCLAKFLSEALAKSNPAYLIRKDIRENPELVQKARDNREQPVADNETKVSIDRLLPGMKLSQPLYAFDGKQLLEEDLTLDQDLIWRIWQLSALRPINAPVIILRKKSALNEEDSKEQPSASPASLPTK